MRKDFQIAALALGSIALTTVGALAQEFIPVAGRTVGALDMAKIPLWLGFGGMGVALAANVESIRDRIRDRSPD